MKKKLTNVLFLCSIIFIMDLTMLPEDSLGIGIASGGINLIPFYTITRLFFYQSISNLIINNIGNVVLFIPFGFMLPIRFQCLDNITKVCIISVLFSMTIECIQLYMPYRWTDIDDVILNSIGAGVGYSLFKLYKNKLNNKI